MECPLCKETIIDGALKCKHCGSMVNELNIGNNYDRSKVVNKSNTKTHNFSWIALLFNTSYYAGYGKMGKAIICGIIGFIPLTLIPVAIYLGFNANKELPVGDVPFNWGKAISMGVLQFFIAVTIVAAIK